MESTQMILTIIGANIALVVSSIGVAIALFLWSRAENRSDCRRIEGLITTIKDEVTKEMKDFHGRLCTLEEKYRQIK